MKNLDVGVRGRVRDDFLILPLTPRKMELDMALRMWPLFSAHSPIGGITSVSYYTVCKTLLGSFVPRVAGHVGGWLHKGGEVHVCA